MHTRTAGLRVAAAPVALVAGLALAGCADDEPVAVPGTTTSTTPASPSPTSSAEQVDLSTLLSDGTAYDDRTVTTTGVVNGIAPGFATLSPEGGTTPSASPSATGSASDEATAPGVEENPLYVLYSGLEVPDDGTTVTVTGTVQDPFDAGAIEDTLGITLDQGVLESLQLGEDDVVLVADTIGAGMDDGAMSPTPSG